MSIIQKIEKGKFTLWLHPDQIKGYVKGTEILKYLTDNNLLDGCAILEDLEEIQKQGIEFYRKYFKDNFIYAWKSVRYSDDNLYVPYLYELDDKVVLNWDWADDGWFGDDPALRHASSQKSDTLPSSTLPSDLESRLKSLEEDMNKIKKILII